jgi:hypothetical protein
MHIVSDQAYVGAPIANRGFTDTSHFIAAHADDKCTISYYEFTIGCTGCGIFVSHANLSAGLPFPACTDVPTRESVSHTSRKSVGPR